MSIILPPNCARCRFLFQVLSSSFTKCVTVPMETVSTGIGRSVRNLFSEIPVTWQPIVMVTLVLLSLISVMMLCSYKLSLPFLLRLEPSQRTPVIYRTCRQVRRTRRQKHRKHQRQKYHYESDDSQEHSFWLMCGHQKSNCFRFLIFESIFFTRPNLFKQRFIVVI